MKILTTAITFLLILMLTSCQPTPDTEYVVGKDDEQKQESIDKAAESKCLVNRWIVRGHAPFVEKFDYPNNISTSV